MKTLLALILSGSIALGATESPFLESYEKIRLALVADDLSAVRQAAAALGEEGAVIAQSAFLSDARKEFETLSAKALRLIAGQPGYYVMYCSMVKKEWVQRTPKVGNPYGGKAMPTCGEIKSRS